VQLVSAQLDERLRPPTTTEIPCSAAAATFVVVVIDVFMVPRLLPAADDSAAVVALDRDSDAIVVFVQAPYGLGELTAALFVAIGVGFGANVRQQQERTRVGSVVQATNDEKVPKTSPCPFPGHDWNNGGASQSPASRFQPPATNSVLKQQCNRARERRSFLHFWEKSSGGRPKGAGNQLPTSADRQSSRHYCSQQFETSRPKRVDPTRQPNQLTTMPSCSRSVLLLVSLFVAAFHHLPTVRAQFNEADCLSCVGDYEGAFNFTNPKIYCEVGEIGSGTYECVSYQDNIDSDLCSDNENTTHAYDWSCDPDLFEDAAGAFLGLAIGLVICFWVCIAVVGVAIVGGIVACVLCCVRGSKRSPQQQYAGASPPMVLPGTMATSTDKTTTQMMTANAAVMPAQTGLASGMDSPYHPPTYDDNNNNNNNNNNYKA
jgi:hypothetical protein